MAIYGKFCLKEARLRLKRPKDMRAILMLPATQAEPNVLAVGASSLLLRLDGPCARAREAAREIVDRAGSAGGPRIFAQVSPAGSAALDADLTALVAPGLAGVFLEACAGRAHVRQVSAKLSVREAEIGLSPGAVKIVALAAQTPAAIFALGDYSGASERLAGLALDDVSPPGGDETRRTARTLLILGAAAAGVPAIGLAPDVEGPALDAACAAARLKGFSGLIGRSMRQIEAIERAFPGA
jgi:citrate lyase subunit beta / citryl-CoA lyase